jgi:squalene-hopene/tetraprenyl-beta-curcumene cyclase
MKRLQFCLALATLSFTPALLTAQDTSFRNEVEASIKKGIGFLAAKQNPDGSWGDATVPAIQPALTALAVMSYCSDPANAKELPAPAKKAIAFLLSKQQADGGIYVDKALATYNSALALSALSLAPLTPETTTAGIKLRRFVVGLQTNFDDKNQPVKDGKADNQYNGGIGYTSKTTYSDLSNTYLALEALHYSKNLFGADTAQEKSEPQLDFDAAIKFVSRCQNLKSGNDQAWVNELGGNKGGFVYRPGESKTEPMKTEDGRDALRSYGSMGYAGLLSYIYADVKPTDTRVTAVKEWLGKNYTLEENPGMGQQGLFYYFHTMSKTLALLDEFKTADGKPVEWRKDLSKLLFNKQNADGSWANENGRWMEKDPILVTSYAVLALGHLFRGV